MTDLKIYACGGTAANVITKYRKTEFFNPTKVDVSFMDTSRANIPDDVDDSEVFIVGGKGSGAIRGKNHLNIADRVPSAILSHPPGDLNVVLFSGGGGTGSVFGPAIVRELIASGEDVVAIVVGSDDSINNMVNTRNTLATLENMAINVLDAPIVMCYHRNYDVGSDRVDNSIINNLELLRVIHGAKPSGLDESDIHHWLRYPLVTTATPSLAILDIVTNDTVDEVASSAISVLSIGINHDVVRNIGIAMEYNTFGIVEDEDDLPTNFEAAHYIINDERVSEYVSELDDLIAKSKAHITARKQRNSIIDSNVKATDDGMIL